MDATKQEIAILQRELDVAQREGRLRAAAYYADAGTMLREPSWIEMTKRAFAFIARELTITVGVEAREFCSTARVKFLARHHAVVRSNCECACAMPQTFFIMSSVPE